MGLPQLSGLELVLNIAMSCRIWPADTYSRQFVFSLVSLTSPQCVILDAAPQINTRTFLAPAGNFGNAVARAGLVRQPNSSSANFKSSSSRVTESTTSVTYIHLSTVGPVTSFIEQVGSTNAECSVKVKSLCNSGNGFLIFNLEAAGPVFCGIAETQHTSPEVFYVLDVHGGHFCQKCRADGCSSKRTPWMPLPATVWSTCKTITH